MTQQTVSMGGTQIVEPSAPLLPVTDGADGSPDNRRKLQLVGAGVGVGVLALAGFFLLKGGSSGASDSGFVPPHHTPKAAAAPASAPVVKLPKRVVTPVGRDPFKALYTAPVAAAVAAPTTTQATTPTTPTTTTGGTGSTTSTGTTGPTFHPVSLQMRSISGSVVTFLVGYSNGKTFKAVKVTVTASRTHAVTFAGSFALESLRNGVAMVKFGDGSPFLLDQTHNTMIVA